MCIIEQDPYWMNPQPTTRNPQPATGNIARHRRSFAVFSKVSSYLRLIDLMDHALSNKLSHLRTILQALDRVLVAFSGGVDSSLLLAVAAQTLGPENVMAVIGHSPIRPSREY